MIGQKSAQIAALIFSFSERKSAYITIAALVVAIPFIVSLLLYFLIGIFEVRILHIMFFLFQPLSSLALTANYYLSRFLIYNRHDRAKRVIQWLSNSKRPLRSLKQVYFFNRFFDLVSLNVFLTLFTILWVGAYTLLKIFLLPQSFQPNFLSQGTPIPCEGWVGFKVVFGSWFYLTMLVILGYSFLSILDFILSIPLRFFPNSENRENWITLIKVFLTLSYIFCIDGIFPYIPKFYRPPFLIPVHFSRDYSFFLGDPAFENLRLTNPYGESGLFKIRSIVFPILMLYLTFFDLSFLDENPLWFSFNEGLLLFSPQDNQAWMVDRISIEILAHLLGYPSKMTTYQMIENLDQFLGVKVSTYAYTLTLRMYPNLSGSLNLYVRHQILEKQLKEPLGEGNLFIAMLDAELPIFLLINFFELSVPSPNPLGLGHFKILGEGYGGLIEGVKTMLAGSRIVHPLVKASSLLAGVIYLLIPILLDFLLFYLFFDKFD